MSSTGGSICRRTFLKGSLASLALPGSIISPFISSGSLRADSGPSVLSIAEDGDYLRATETVVEGLGGMSAFVPRGSVVVVKPNIGWDRTVEQGANTHPDVVRAVIVMCIEAGARSITVLDRTCNDARRSYKNSGILEMVTGLGDKRVHLEFVRNGLFRNVKFPEGKAIKEWPLYSPALDADVLINIPVAKHHSISRLTLAMKNLMGLMGGNRGNIHSRIDQKLADVTAVLSPTLNILDATRIMLRNGPTGGRLSDVKVLNRVAASTDPVLLDAYGTTLFGLEPGDIPSVKAGYASGLGEMDLARARLVGGSI